MNTSTSFRDYVHSQYNKGQNLRALHFPISSLHYDLRFNVKTEMRFMSVALHARAYLP